AMKDLRAVEGYFQVADFHEIGSHCVQLHRSRVASGFRRDARCLRHRIRDVTGDQGAAGDTGTGYMDQLGVRKSIAKAGAAFQLSEDFIPVNTAFWCSML